MNKVLFLLTFLSANFCDESVFHVVDRVEKHQKIIHTVDLDGGQAYRAVLKIKTGRASLDVANVTNKTCSKRRCRFTAASGIQELSVSGNPGPAIYDLRVLPL